VLPIGRAPGQKSPPPGSKAAGVTWTGHGAPYPGPIDIASWESGPEAAYNVGLRAPEGVIGLDVDHYGKKNGGDVLAALEARFGPLPPTWVSSARPAPSGIRWFRVPTHLDGREVNWPGEAGKFIEIIQAGHRYAVVWPSINPEAAGAQYEWRWSEAGRGNRRGDVPAPDELPPLPEAWIRGLMLDYDRTEKADLGGGDMARWWAGLRNGAPCPVVKTVSDRVLNGLRTDDGSRHEATRDAAAALARLGGEGHVGTPAALSALGATFEELIGAARAASGEWRRLLTGAVKLAAADNSMPRQSCEHDALTAYAGPPGFDLAASLAEAQQQAEAARRQQAVAAARVNLDRLDELRAEVEALPFPERADAVRRLIPEIAGWAPAEQDRARDLLSTKHLFSDLGVTDFRKLLQAEERARRTAAEEAAIAEGRRVAAEQVERARAEGTLLSPPHAPIDVARELAARMPVPAKWWRGDYYRWNGTRYVLWRDEAVDNWLYGQTGDAWYEAGEDKGTAPWRPTENKITGVSHALSRGVLYRPSEDDPDDSPAQVACSNGVYDVTADALLPHTPERFNLQSVPFPFDPAATAPTWQWFLDDVLPGDVQAHAFLQEWFGYVLSGRTDLEKIANLMGQPRCGKGTVADTLSALVGAENVAAPTIPSLVGTFGEQPLLGKTLAVFSDISWAHRDIVSGVEIIKAISGRDARDVQRKNREVWHGKLGARFMIMGNDMPKFTDASGAFTGRMIHVQFPGSFFGRERPGVKAALLDELPGILNWALAGLKRLTENGRFTQPRSGEELAAEVRRQQSPVQAFLDDTCALVDPASVPPVPLDELHPVYRAWAKQSDMGHALDRERFSAALRSAGLGVKRQMVNGVRARRVYGVVPQVEQDGRTAWVSLLNPSGPPPVTEVTPPEGWIARPDS
jgi:putative DNA primase/helicase